MAWLAISTYILGSLAWELQVQLAVLLVGVPLLVVAVVWATLKWPSLIVRLIAGAVGLRLLSRGSLWGLILFLGALHPGDKLPEPHTGATPGQP